MCIENVIYELLFNIDGELTKDMLLENDGELVDSGLLQSMTIVELCVSLEEKYNFEMSLEDMDKINFNSIESVVRLINKYIY